MKLVIVAIKDRAIDAFGTPFFVAHLGGALRSFSDEVNRRDPEGKNQLAAHPEDFDLYEIGVYDDASAKFELLERPRQVAVGKDQVRS